MDEHRVIRGLFMVAVVIGTAFNALADAFTWQGRVLEAGQPSSGVYDFQFKLWDALSSGGQIGGTLTAANVLVSDGLATIDLNFGAGVFNGDSRWLEIAVKADADAAYTTLSPRQPIRAAPHASYAASAGAVADGSLPASYTNAVSFTSPSNSFTGSSLHVGSLHTGSGNVGIGTTSPERLLHVAGGDAGLAPHSNSILVVERSTSAYMNVITPSASESGLLFGNPTGGSAAGGIIFNGSAAPQGLQFRVNGNLTKMVLQSDGNLGVGTNAPQADLHVRGDSPLGEAIITPGTSDSSAQLRLTENVSASLGGILRYDGAMNQMQVLGLNFDGVTAPHLTIGRDNGRVGIGTTSPASALHVNGEITLPVTTRDISFHPKAFSPDYYATQYTRSIFALFNHSGHHSFSAPVHLPAGAVVKEVMVSYKDSTSTENMTVKFMRSDFAVVTGGVTLAQVVSSGSSSSYRTMSTTSITEPTIDNTLYMYFLEASWTAPSSGSLILTGVRIRYEVTSPLP